MPKKSWTFEEVKEIASQYTNLSDFRKNDTNAYFAAYRNFWIDEVTEHMVTKRKIYSDVELHEKAKKYSSRSEFSRRDSSAYQAASRRGILDDICSHMQVLRRPNGYWTKEKILERMKEVKNYQQFIREPTGAYYAAVQQGILDEVRAVATVKARKRTNYTVEMITEAAKAYRKRSDFRLHDKAAYNAAQRMKILDEVCAHMPSSHGVKRGHWTDETLLEEARKYSSKTEFAREAGFAYKKALANNLVDKIDAIYESKKAKK